MTPGVGVKTPGGTAAGRSAAVPSEPGSGVSSCSGGALPEESPKAGGGDEGKDNGGGGGDCEGVGVGVGVGVGDGWELRPAGPSWDGRRVRGRRSSPLGVDVGEVAASALPGEGEGQGEGEDASILHIRLPSPTKLAAKHFRQSPVANSQNSTFGLYDA